MSRVLQNRPPRKGWPFLFSRCVPVERTPERRTGPFDKCASIWTEEQRDEARRAITAQSRYGSIVLLQPAPIPVRQIPPQFEPSRPAAKPAGSQQRSAARPNGCCESSCQWSGTPAGSRSEPIASDQILWVAKNSVEPSDHLVLNRTLPYFVQFRGVFREL